MEKDKELKVPYYTSTAAIYNRNLPYILILVTLLL